MGYTYHAPNLFPQLWKWPDSWKNSEITPRQSHKKWGSFSKIARATYTFPLFLRSLFFGQHNWTLLAIGMHMAGQLVQEQKVSICLSASLRLKNYARWSTNRHKHQQNRQIMDQQNKKQSFCKVLPRSCKFVLPSCNNICFLFVDPYFDL